jgi:hypothetical protein
MLGAIYQGEKGKQGNDETKFPAVKNQGIY